MSTRVILLLTLMLVGNAVADSWRCTLGVIPGAGAERQIVFGVDPAATDGLDPELGELNLPPWPPQDEFDVRFQRSGLEGLLLDLRADDATSKTYTIRWQAGEQGLPLTLNWDRSSLPDARMRLRDPYGGAVFSEVDLFEQDHLVLNNRALDRVFLVVSPGLQNTDPPRIELPEYQAVYQGQRFAPVHLAEKVLDPDNNPDEISWMILPTPPLSVTQTAGIAAVTYPESWLGEANVRFIAADPEQNRDTLDCVYHVSAGGVSGWTLPLSICSHSGQSSVLRAGLQSSASDELDLALGEAELPPVPPSGVFDARFLLPDGTATLTDFRQALMQETVWTLHIQADTGGWPIVIRWSQPLPPGSFLLEDGLGGVVFASCDLATCDSLLLQEYGLDQIQLRVQPVLDVTPPTVPGELRVIQAWADSCRLSWLPSYDENFHYYEIVGAVGWFDSNPTFVFDHHDAAELATMSSCEVVLPWGLDQDAFFRARAWDSFGNVSEKSNIISVSHPPDVFELLNPPNLMDVSRRFPGEMIPLLFEWEATVDPDDGDTVSYTFELAQSPSFAGSQRFALGDATQYSWSSLPLEDGDWYWRVHARDPYFNTRTSATRRFQYLLDSTYICKISAFTQDTILLSDTGYSFGRICGDTQGLDSILVKAHSWQTPTGTRAGSKVVPRWFEVEAWPETATPDFTLELSYLQSEMETSGIVTEISLIPHFRSGLYWYPGEGGVTPVENLVWLATPLAHKRWSLASSIEATISPGFNLRFGQEPQLTTVTPSERDSLCVTFSISNTGLTGLSNIAWRATRTSNAALCEGTLTDFLAPGATQQVQVLLDANPTSGEQCWHFELDPEQRIIESNEEDNSAELCVTVLTRAEPMLVSMILSDTLLAPGDPLDVSLLIRNTGEESLSGVEYALEALDSEGHSFLVACGAFDINGSSQQTLLLSYTPEGAPGMHYLTASLDPQNILSWEDADNNTAAASLRTRQPGLAISWSAPTTLAIGEIDNFRVRVTNTTEIPLGETSLSLGLPANLELVGSSPEATSESTWSYAQMLGGVTETVILQLRAPEGLGLEGQVVSLLAEGHALSAGESNSLAASSEHVVELGEDTRPPLLSLDVSNSHLSALDVVLTLSANEALATSPRILLTQLGDTLYLQEMTGNAASWTSTMTPDPDWAAGNCQLSVSAQDLRGNSASVERTLVVDHTPPYLVGSVPVWINHDSFRVTLTPNEELRDTPVVVFNTDTDTIATTLRRSGSSWQIDARLPESSVAEWAVLRVSAVDLAGNSGVRCDTLRTDFIAPELTHNLPGVVAPGMVEVLIQCNETLAAAPTFTAHDAAGRLLSQQGPYALGGNYKIFLLIPTNITSGTIQVNCSGSDLAGNTGSFAHQIACDVSGPELTLSVDPEWPTGEFVLRVRASEPLQASPELILTSARPGYTLPAPEAQFVDGAYEYWFSEGSLAKVEVLARDTLGLCGTTKRTWLDIAMPAQGFLFSDLPDGSQDVTVEVPVQNNCGVPVQEACLLVFNGSADTTHFLGDTVRVSIPAWSTVYAEVNWPRERQGDDYRLLAWLNKDEELPETSYLNNLRTFQRMLLQTQSLASSWQLGVDSVAIVQLSVYSGMSGNAATQDEFFAWADLQDSSGVILADSVQLAAVSGQWFFPMPMETIPAAGSYDCVIHVDDYSGLPALKDTVALRVIDPIDLVVYTDTLQYHRGEDVQIQGRLLCADTSLVQGVAVSLRISSSGGTRTLSATTDATGNFSEVFSPYSSEAGDYTLRASATPAGVSLVRQTSFNMYGLLLAPSQVSVRLSRNSEQNGEIILRNIGTRTIHGLSCALGDTLPAEGLELLLGACPDSLRGGQVARIPVQVIASPGDPVSVTTNIRIESDEEETENGTLTITAEEARPSIHASASNTEVVLIPGQSVLRQVYFVNSGLQAAFSPEIETPQISFLQVFAPNGVPAELGIGDTLLVNLLFAPDSLADEGLHSGYLRFKCQNHAAVSSGVSAFVTHNTLGRIRFAVSNSINQFVPRADIFLYSQEYDPYTHRYPVYHLSADSTGSASLDSLRSGSYRWQVSADQHSTKTGQTFLEPVPGMIQRDSEFQEVSVTLDLDLIDYNWIVEETTIVDEYEITLEVDIDPIPQQEERLMPPVLVADPPVIVEQFIHDDYIFGTFRIANHGDLTAYGFELDQTELLLSDADGVDRYRVVINPLPTLMTTGLARNASATIDYYVERLYDDINPHRLQTWMMGDESRLHMLGHYDVDGLPQFTEVFVDFDLSTWVPNCFSIHPHYLVRTTMLGEIIEDMTTTSVRVTNRSPYGTMEFEGGLGRFVVDKSFGPQAIIEGMINEFTGGLLDLMNLINDVVDIYTGEWDATLDAVDVPAESSVVLPVNWSESGWALNVVRASFGFMAAGYQCPTDDMSRFTMLPMFGVDILPVVPHDTGGGYVYVNYPSSSSYGTGTGSPTGGGGHISVLPGMPGVTEEEVERVHLTIDQRLTLERQAFNVALELTNDTDFEISDFAMNVITRDEEGEILTEDETDPEGPLFFQSPILTNITGIDGSGVIHAHSSAVIHWLVIPRTHSGGECGMDYQLQGSFSFAIADTTLSILTEASPITVNPMPLLDVTYALPQYFDASIPFQMATAISNRGYGTAFNVNLTSAQPQMVCYNAQGQVVPCGSYDVEITGAWMEGEAVSPELHLAYGDIVPDQTKVGYWDFLSTFDGRVTDFSASYTHAAELGGESTSLLNSVSAHIMLNRMDPENGAHLIVADSTDDGEPDYVLDPDGGLWHDLQRCYPEILHEADFDEPWLSFALDCDEGWSWFKVTDPFDGSMRIVDVYTSDGEHIPFNRYWLREGEIFFVDLVEPGTVYTIDFGPPVAPDLSLPRAYSNWQPQYPLETDSLSLSLGVYNAGEQDTDGRLLDLFLVIDGDSTRLRHLIVPPVPARNRQNLIVPLAASELQRGFNRLVAWLDPSELRPDDNRSNNLLALDVFINTKPLLESIPEQVCYEDSLLLLDLSSFMRDSTHAVESLSLSIEQVYAYGDTLNVYEDEEALCSNFNPFVSRTGGSQTLKASERSTTDDRAQVVRLRRSSTSGDLDVIESALVGRQPLRNAEWEVSTVGSRLSLKAPENWFGESLFSVAAYDTCDASSDPVNVSHTVLPVNDAPVLWVHEITMIEDDSLSLPFHDFVRDADDVDSLLRVSFEFLIEELEEETRSVNGGSVASANKTGLDSREDLPVYLQIVDGTFSLSTADNYWVDSLAVLVEICDPSVCVQDTLVIHITPVNDSPQMLRALDVLLLEEDAPTVCMPMSNYFYDADGDTLHYNLTWTEPAPASAEMELDTLRITPLPDGFGTGLLTVTVNDDLCMLSDSLRLVVTPVNDAPYLRHPLADVEWQAGESGLLIPRLESHFADVDEDPLYYTVTVTPTLALDSLVLHGNLLSDRDLLTLPMPEQDEQQRQVTVMQTRSETSRSSLPEMQAEADGRQSLRAVAMSEKELLSPMMSYATSTPVRAASDTTSLWIYPRAGYAGSIELQVRAYDPAWLSAVDTMVVEIAGSAGPAYSIVSPDTVYAAVGESVEFSVGVANLLQRPLELIDRALDLEEVFSLVNAPIGEIAVGDTARLVLRYQPLEWGFHQDVLQLELDADPPIYDLVLRGVARMAMPEVQGLTIRPSSHSGVRLEWSPLTEMPDGSPVEVAGYRIEVADDPWVGDYDWMDLAFTSGTYFTHYGIAQSGVRRFYRVVAVIQDAVLSGSKSGESELRDTRSAGADLERAK